MSKKTVMVSGCFDMLHSGHIEFFNQASQFGDLHVALGSDKTISDLKGRQTLNNQNERLFMVKSVRYVKDTFISKGSGTLDFVDELKKINPDIFIVNEDGHLPEKEDLCKSLGVEYKILERKPHHNLTQRSTTELRLKDYLPYRIDLAGGWLDQPFVSKLHPGPVVTISIEPTIDFNKRSGMATSTRTKAEELWGPRIPHRNYEHLAQILFSYDNPPGTKTISGSQDSIGIVFPGLAKANYSGKYWPESITHITNNNLLRFVEQSLFLIPLKPRQGGYDVLANTQINEKNAKLLADSAENLWDATLGQKINDFGFAMREAFEAQIRMFPNMMNPQVEALINKFKDQALGWKLSGAGGGGYLILVSDEKIPGSIQVTARRAFD